MNVHARTIGVPPMVARLVTVCAIALCGCGEPATTLTGTPSAMPSPAAVPSLSLRIDNDSATAEDMHALDAATIASVDVERVNEARTELRVQTTVSDEARVAYDVAPFAADAEHGQSALPTRVLVNGRPVSAHELDALRSEDVQRLRVSVVGAGAEQQTVVHIDTRGRR